MNELPEGKIPWDVLSNLVKLRGYQNNKGVIQEAAPGIDVATLDLQEIIQQIQEYYNSSNTPYLIYKADPITFPTPNPAKYLVTVNMNDLATCGAIPYGITITILLPPRTLGEKILEFQKKLSEICTKNGISILGGHSEVTSSVDSPIYSASMIGFVPPEYYIPRNPKSGDVIICSGWIGAEGTGILLTSGKEYFSTKLSEEEIEEGFNIGKNISISKKILTLNREYHEALSLVHDATEGGIYGALYECLAPFRMGCEIKSFDIPITRVTEKIAQYLNINPYKLISSGAVILICNKERAPAVLKFLNENTSGPHRIIGSVTHKGSPMNFDGQKMHPPKADDLIKGLSALKQKRN
ncbi:MAG: AIR synthase related protein [Candidatus Hodarchaeales archaeon]|jgi:hydrogenase expression/formation protein HypE